MNHREIQQTKFMVRAIASVFYVGLFWLAIAIDAFIIRSGLSRYAAVAIMVAGAFIVFPILDGIVERRLRRASRRDGGK